MKKFLFIMLFPMILFGQTYTSQYPTQDDSHVIATSTNAGQHAYYATDPTNPLINSSHIWTGDVFYITQIRFHIDLGSAKVITRIYYENSQQSGSQMTGGAKNFTFWGSNSSADFNELTYATNGTWTQLTTSQTTFDIHASPNAPDPKYITVTNSTAYRYYAVKLADNWGNAYYLGMNRIELQTTSASAPTVTTEAVSDITSAGGVGNGTVVSDGGSTITEYGVVIGETENPNIGENDMYSYVESWSGAFTSPAFTALNANALYHVRAFATNSIGTSYGADVTFTTLTSFIPKILFMF
jgi:hypothetical protein